MIQSVRNQMFLSKKGQQNLKAEMIILCYYFWSNFTKRILRVQFLFKVFPNLSVGLFHLAFPEGTTYVKLDFNKKRTIMRETVWFLKNIFFFLT